MKTLIPELHRIDPVRAAGLARQTESLIGILKLMNDAEALLRAGKTTEALALYILPFAQADKSGVTLPSSQFESSDFGEIITSKVKREIASIVATTQEQLKSVPNLAPVLPAVTTLLGPPSAPGGTPQDLATRFDALTAPLLAAAASEGVVRNGAASLAEINRTIQQASDKGRDNLYLRYVLWLVLGRDNKQEGIARAIDLLWADQALQIQKIADTGATDAFQSARAAFDSGGLTAADTAFQGFLSRSILAAKASALLSARFPFGPASGWELSGADAPVMKDALARALAVQEYAAEAGAYRLLIGYRKDLDALPSTAFTPLTASPAVLSAESARLVSARASLDARSAEARAQEASWTARGASWQSAAAVTEAGAPLAESARRVAALFRAFADTDLTTRDIAYALRIAAIGGSGFPGRLAAAVDLRRKAEDLTDGKVNGQVPSELALVQKHPDDALNVLASAGTNIQTLIADISAHEGKLQGEKDYVKANPGFTALFEGNPGQPGYTALLQSAQAELEALGRDTVVARSQADAAAAALVEGDKLFKNAQDAFASGDTKAATANLSGSVLAYNRVLENQYSEYAKSRTTKDFLELTAKIDKLNLATITASAQKNEAAIRDLISKPDYIAARERLTAAMAAWPSDKLGGMYQPYVDLDQQIQNGLAATQGLTFDRRDPRAEPVNALLASSQANLSASRLNEARQNIVDALSVAPNYGAARVLELKITRASDPVAFKKKADEQIAAYRLLAAESTVKDKLYPVYLALLSYSGLDASYKDQLADQIQKLRYKLGLDTPPATVDQKRQADALLRDARALAKDGSDEGYQQALAKIAEVSKIIPLYPPARALSQELANQRVQTPPDQLSPAAQQKYNQAWGLYLKGALNEAYAIVTDLWSNRNNQPYVPLQQLRAYLQRDLHL